MARHKKLKSILLLITIWLFGHIIYTIIDGVKDEKKTADIAIILGNKVNPDGTLSERLLKRLECGLDVYKAGRVNKIIVSGGLGQEGYYEGDKMKEFLVKQGVPENIILVDNNGINTRATVENTMKLKASLNFNSAIIISQYFHVTRTKMLFKRQGLNNISSVSPQYFEFRDIYSLLREFIAYYTQ